MYVQASCIAGAYVVHVHTPRGPFVVIVKKNTPFAIWKYNSVKQKNNIFLSERPHCFFMCILYCIGRRYNHQ